MNATSEALRVVIALSAMIGVVAPASTGVTVRPARLTQTACPSKPASLAAIQGVRCGYLAVPENRNAQNGRTIRLSVAIVPAASAKSAADPIVWLTGGPGFDAFTQAKFVIDWGLNRDRNVILMSQRGTYSSKPSLTCPNVDRFNASSVGLLYDAPSTGKLHAQAVKACRRGFAVRGIDLSAYNTIESAADYEDLRTALGLPKWNVWGMSYGTDVALTYLRLYPSGIRSVGIDGVVPPDVAGSAFAWPSLKEGIYGVFAACAAQPPCRQRYPHLAATFTRLVRQLESHPVTTNVKSPATGKPVKVVIDGGVLVNLMVPATHAAATLPSLLDELARGHPQQLAERWADRQIGDPKEYGSFSYGLTYGVLCGEWAAYESPTDVIAAGRRAFPSFPESVLAQAPQFAYLWQDCAAWNVAKAPASVRDPTRSAIPTLVMSGSFDAQTGAQWGRHAARTLSRAVVVTIPGVAHITIAASPCARSVVTSFFDDPTAPQLACVRSLKAASFKIAPANSSGPLHARLPRPSPG
jgi:pimeloyl-ACP methyl ester carboxylesterase